AGRLAHGAGGINRVEAVLLQEILPQDAADFNDEPFVVLERVGTDELHDFLEVAFPLQHFDGAVDEFRVVLSDVFAVPLLKNRGEQRVRTAPVDGREVTAAGQCGIERPEAARDAQRGLRHRFREVTAGRTYGPDDGNG